MIYLACKNYELCTELNYSLISLLWFFIIHGLISDVSITIYSYYIIIIINISCCYY